MATFLVPDGAPLQESNDCHKPGGAGGGQFCGALAAHGLRVAVRNDSYDPGMTLLRVLDAQAHQKGFLELRTAKSANQLQRGDYPSNHLLVWRIEIDADLQRKGVGHGLYQEGLKWAQAHGYAGLSSNVTERTPAAHRAWQRLGRVRHEAGFDLLDGSAPTRESNDCHKPGGAGGGQFCKGPHSWGPDTTHRRDVVQCATCGKRAKRARVEAAQKAAVNRRIFKAIRDRD